MRSLDTTIVASAAFLLASAGQAAIDLKAPVNYQTPQRPAGVVGADFAGDGLRDLAVITDTPDKVSLLTNTGGGQFSGPTNFPINNGSGAGHAVAFDVDADGDLDLAVALQNSANIRVMLNQGGTFTNGPTTAVGQNPRWIEVGNFDGQGGLDLAVVNRDSGSVSILLATGGGNYSVSTVNIGGELRAAARGDFDGDGDPDLAVSNHDDRTIRILTNNGGVFSAGATLQVNGERPEGIVAADLDGDGDPDLATTIDNNDIGFVLVYTNNGGAFSGPQQFATGGGLNPGTIIAADLDLDGAPELITTNEDSGNISILPNNGNGTFGAAVVIATGTTPEFVTAADLDGNGGMDLAVTNRDSNTTAVILNNAGGGGCAPDLDGNGTLDLFDFLAFQNLFNAQDPAADCEANGVFDLFDFLCYQNLFVAGC